MFCKVSWFALEGSNVSCDCRLKSHRGSKLRAQNNNLLMGGTLSKPEINGFQRTFTVLTCSRCSPLQHLVGFGFQAFHQAARAMG